MLLRGVSAAKPSEARRPCPTPEQLLARIEYYNARYGNKPQPRVIVMPDATKSDTVSA
jgi:hypothetical protein